MATIISSKISTIFALLLSLILCLTPTILAQDSTPTPTATPKPAIYNGNDMVGYIYHGCYNETTELGGTGGGSRALYMGKNEVKPGEMTVQKCLSFCKDSIQGGYKFAGLEYAKECWCAQQLLSLSAKLDDSACTLPCDGDKSQICGGALKLTVYVAGAPLRVVRGLWVAGLAALVGMGLVI